LSSARSEHWLPLAEGEAVSLVVRRHARARRLRLRFDGVADQALLTIPPRLPLRDALAWAHGQARWVEAQRGRAGGVIRLGDGVMVPVEGMPHAIVATGSAGRSVRCEDGRLIVGGPADLAGGRVQRWLRARARKRLTDETRSMAQAHGLPLRDVSLGDPRSRWGSCSARGNIRYSWRLILAPPHVRLATVAHEVAHLRHMNHGPDFHALVRAISPVDPDAARLWLRREGAGLHRYIG